MTGDDNQLEFVGDGVYLKIKMDTKAVQTAQGVLKVVTKHLQRLEREHAKLEEAGHV